MSGEVRSVSRGVVAPGAHSCRIGLLLLLPVWLLFLDGCHCCMMESRQIDECCMISTTIDMVVAYGFRCLAAARSVTVAVIAAVVV